MRPQLGIMATLVLATVSFSGPARAEGPSFDCAKAEAGSIEALICGDAALSAADRKMAEVYRAASTKAGDEQPPVLKGEQRGWIKGRDECWKSDAQRACVADAYRSRIAELQARYRLVPITGSAVYVCDGQPANEVIATYFATDPPTAIAERGDQVSLMYQQPSGIGAKYQGPNEMIWEHKGEAMISWGYGNPEMRCVVER